MTYGYCEHCGSGPTCGVCGRGGRAIDMTARTPIPTRDVYKHLGESVDQLRELISDACDAQDAFTDDELEEFARKHQQDTSLPEFMRGRP